MVASSQTGCIRSELIPRRDTNRKVLISLFVRNPLQTRKLQDVLFPARVARCMHLMREAAKKKRSSGVAQ